LRKSIKRVKNEESTRMPNDCVICSCHARTSGISILVAFSQRPLVPAGQEFHWGIFRSTSHEFVSVDCFKHFHITTSQKIQNPSASLRQEILLLSYVGFIHVTDGTIFQFNTISDNDLAFTSLTFTISIQLSILFIRLNPRTHIRPFLRTDASINYLSFFPKKQWIKGHHFTPLRAAFRQTNPMAALRVCL
jgi:hypothetical protein